VFSCKEFLLFPHVRCILSWGRALGLFGGLSNRQLLLLAPYGKKKKEKTIQYYCPCKTISTAPQTKYFY